ncbi:MAG: hypothetical protein HOV79_00525 [Hamadaea sp.]|nr:hypothetical protein [Hamadaea sp.]
MHRTRHRMLAAITGSAYRGPARRDDAGGSTPPGDASNGGGGTGDDGKTGDTKNPQIKGDFDPDRAARDLGKARQDAADEKTKRQAAEKKHQDSLDAIAVALGFKPDPKTDPTQLVAQAASERDKATADARAKTIELAVYKAAGKAGGDPDALLDSRGFLDALADLDPAAKDFAAKVTAAITDAVKDNPRLAAQQSGAQGGQGPARQGADHSGGGNNSTRPTSLGAAIRGAYDGK